jgi:hypothetical protein
MSHMQVVWSILYLSDEGKGSTKPNPISQLHVFYSMEVIPDFLFLLVCLTHYLTLELRIEDAMRHTHRPTEKKEDKHKEWSLPCVNAPSFPTGKCSRVLTLCDRSDC